jgi:hypothetical protein
MYKKKTGTRRDSVMFELIATLFFWIYDSPGLHRNLTETRDGFVVHTDDTKGKGYMTNCEGLNVHEECPIH